MSALDTGISVQLPPEIVAEVAAHLSGNDVIEQRLSLSTLKACSLVSRDFFAVFRPLAFSYLELKVEKDEFKLDYEDRQKHIKSRLCRLLQLFQSNPVIPSYVRTFVLSLNDSSNGGRGWISSYHEWMCREPTGPLVLDQLHSVTHHVYLSGGIFMDQPRSEFMAASQRLYTLPTITKLELYDSFFIPASVVIQCAGLRFLTLMMTALSDEGGTIQKSDVHPCGPSSSLLEVKCYVLFTNFHTLMKYHPGFFSHLRKLHLEGITSKDGPQIQAVIQSSGSHLQEFACTAYQPFPSTADHEPKMQRPFDFTPSTGLRRLHLKFYPEGLEEAISSLCQTLASLSNSTIEDVTLLVNWDWSTRLQGLIPLHPGWNRIDKVFATTDLPRLLQVELQFRLVKVEEGISELDGFVETDLLAANSVFPYLCSCDDFVFKVQIELDPVGQHFDDGSPLALSRSAFEQKESALDSNDQPKETGGTTPAVVSNIKPPSLLIDI